MDLLAPALARVALVEAAAADALGPAAERVVDGWRLRFNHGLSRRGNSVLAERRGCLPLARKLRGVEAFYREHGLPPRVQLSPASRPTRLDAVLAERGWLRDPGALVLFSSARALAGGAGEGDGVRASPRPTDGYLQVQEAVAPGAGEWAQARAKSLRTRGLDPWHLVLEEDGRAVSAGLGVHDPERGVVGVFALATRPEARGRGGAGRVLSALARRARTVAAEGLYLQVDVRNRSALRLYARAGYAVHHRYDYRVAP